MHATMLDNTCTCAVYRSSCMCPRPTTLALRAAEAVRQIDELTGGALASPESLIAFFDGTCENAEVLGAPEGTGELCQNREGALDAVTCAPYMVHHHRMFLSGGSRHDSTPLPLVCRRLANISDKCLTVTDVAGGECLPTGTFAHIDVDCFTAIAADVSDATADEIAAITTSFVNIHNACQELTTEVSACLAYLTMLTIATTAW